jgi:hypothetical protein
VLVPVIWFALLFVIWRYGPRLVRLVRGPGKPPAKSTEQAIYDTKFDDMITIELANDPLFAKRIKRSRR